MSTEEKAVATASLFWSKAWVGNTFWLAGHIASKIGLCRPVSVSYRHILLDFRGNGLLAVHFVKGSIFRGS